MKLQYREEAQTQFKVTMQRTIMKMPSFEMGKHGLHNDDKGFCIIILDTYPKTHSPTFVCILLTTTTKYSCGDLLLVLPHFENLAAVSSVV